ncbi:hypothetical protein C1646_777044, partial [Rhizophagus diaphanus]
VQYGISTSTVSDILKRSEHWLSIDTTLPNANNFCEKSSVYPQLEEVMSIWSMTDSSFIRIKLYSFLNKF